MKKIRLWILALVIILAIGLVCASFLPGNSATSPKQQISAFVSQVREYIFTKAENGLTDDDTASDYRVVNDNVPQFTGDDITTESYESYGQLDYLGRCTAAMACLSEETMPKDGETRGDISAVTPSGWKQSTYEILKTQQNESGFLYNRCHLIAWCLGGENDNALNLITGTRHLNETMWHFESQIQTYIYQTGNHVMYRVTPVYSGDNPVADGVQIEAYSVEDNGYLQFNVFCYNNQSGINIDYSTGASRLDAAVS